MSVQHRVLMVMGVWLVTISDIIPSPKTAIVNLHDGRLYYYTTKIWALDAKASSRSRASGTISNYTADCSRVRYIEINDPILWGGHLARPANRAGETPTPQELIGYFFGYQPKTGQT